MKKVASQRLNNNRNMFLTLQCKKHGAYMIIEDRHKQGHICPKCYKEILAKAVSNPICIPALGINNKFVIINKGVFVYGMLMARRIHHKKISAYTRWTKPNTTIDPTINHPDDVIYICKIHVVGSIIKPKINGMKRSMVIYDKKNTIKSNMFYTRTDIDSINETFAETKETNNCEIISGRAQWQVVPNHWVNRPCAEFIGTFANPT